jgi:hypothetical protein
MANATQDNRNPQDGIHESKDCSLSNRAILEVRRDWSGYRIHGSVELQSVRNARFEWSGEVPLSAPK